jgi:serine/threonine protein kinase/tetratricopeptide (TPR) repeat protein
LAAEMLGTLLGPYRIESELGSGGMGAVYAAVVEGDASGLDVGTRVALKVVHARFLESDDARDRFRREVEIGKRVAHENVVRTFDGDERDGHCFMVMEYVEGQTLRGLVEELERVPEELCRHIGRQVSKGLGAIHAAGAVHRDIKPENVMITPEHVVKIMDLGVARSTDDAMRLSQTGMFVGSLQYASPEQFRSGGKELDGRVDLHALGIVLYELAGGRNPFEGDDLPEIVRKVLTETPRRLGELNPQLSPFFEELVHRLLAKDRDARFASAAELTETLEAGESGTWWKERAKSLRAETRRPLRRIRIPRETGVYGREPELAKLRALFESAKSGEGRVALIEGEAGVGKSRLVDELIARLHDDGEDVNFLFGSYPPGAAATAAGAFSTAYHEHFGDGGAAAYLTQTPALVPAFDALLRGEPTPAGAQPLSKESLHVCFVHATHALAAERATVVLIDDLHFAPQEGRALFAALATAVAGRRVLLVGTTRPGLDESWTAGVTRFAEAASIAVPRLGPKDLFALLSDAFHSGRLAQELGMRIAAKSDGNPFFVFEIIRGLREGQFIAKRGDGTWATTRRIEEITIPSSVLDLVQARVADLDEEERELLDMAACLGFEFDPTLVAAACGVAAIPALRRFGRIEKKHRLVRAAGANYVFDHHQVQESLYGGLHVTLRTHYHAAISDALAARPDVAGREPADLDGAVAVALCGHSFQGAKNERAVLCLDRALDHLEARYQHESAVATADLALAPPGLVAGGRRLELLVRKAGLLNHLGRRDDERAALDEALALAESSGARDFVVRIRDLLGLHFLLVGRFAEAQSVLALAIEGARALGDAKTEAAAMGKLGNALYAQRKFDEARARHERQLEIARALGDLRVEAQAAGSLGIIDHAQGRHADARARHERYLALSRGTGDRRGEAIALANLAWTLTALGLLEEARANYEKSAAISREIGFRLGESTATGNLGFVLFRQGRFAEALDLCERNLALSQSAGDRRGMVRSMRTTGDALFALGRVAESASQYERCAALAAEVGDRETEISAAAARAGSILALGGVDEARVLLERALLRARETGERRAEGDALNGLGECADASGDAATAEARHREALALRRGAGLRDGVVESLVAAARVIARVGREDEARALAVEAATLAREVDAPGAETVAACQSALLPRGDVGAALETFRRDEPRLSHIQRMEARFLLFRATRDKTHLAEGRRLLEELRRHAPGERRETVLTHVPLNRAILTTAAAEGTE